MMYEYHDVDGDKTDPRCRRGDSHPFCLHPHSTSEQQQSRQWQAAMIVSVEDEAGSAAMAESVVTMTMMAATMIDDDAGHGRYSRIGSYDDGSDDD